MSENYRTKALVNKLCDRNLTAVKPIETALYEYNKFKSIVEPLDNLIQIMVHPENDPPQLTKAEAWAKYLEILGVQPNKDRTKGEV